MLLACIPLIPVLGSVFIYQVINNEKQDAEIEAIALATKILNDSIFSFNTPLSARVIKLEDRFDEVWRAEQGLARHVDTIDASGTRALIAIDITQQRSLAQVDRISERLIMNDKAMVEMAATIKSLQEKVEEPTRRGLGRSDKTR